MTSPPAEPGAQALGESLAALASDGMFSFSRAPLHIATYLGLGAMLLGLGYSVWLVFTIVFGAGVASPAWSYLIIATHFLGGAVLVCLGILGEYVSRIFEQVKARPVYLLKDHSLETPAVLSVTGNPHDKRDAA